MDFKDNIRKLLYLGLSPLTLFKPRIKGYAVLVYHRITEDKLWDSELTPLLAVRISDFDEQMNFLTKKFKVISLSEIFGRISNSITPDSLFVSITFDDGYADNYLLGAPILQKYMIRATIFVTAAFVEDNHLFPYWDELKLHAVAINNHIACYDIDEKINHFDLSSLKGKKEFLSTVLKWYHKNPETVVTLLAELRRKVPRPIKATNSFFTWELLKEAAASGIFEVGCHTMTHPLFRFLQENGNEEIYESKRLLESRLQLPVQFFSFPFGGSHLKNASIIALLKKSGFKSAFTNNIGLNSERENLFMLKRIPVLGGENISELNSKLLGANVLNTIYSLTSKF